MHIAVLDKMTVNWKRIFFFFPSSSEIVSYYVAQAGAQVLGPSNPPASGDTYGHAPQCLTWKRIFLPSSKWSYLLIWFNLPPVCGNNSQIYSTSFLIMSFGFVFSSGKWTFPVFSDTPTLPSLDSVPLLSIQLEIHLYYNTRIDLSSLFLNLTHINS